METLVGRPCLANTPQLRPCCLSDQGWEAQAQRNWKSLTSLPGKRGHGCPGMPSCSNWSLDGQVHLSCRARWAGRARKPWLCWEGDCGLAFQQVRVTFQGCIIALKKKAGKRGIRFVDEVAASARAWQGPRPE